MIKKITLFALVIVAFNALYAQPTPPPLQPGEYWAGVWSLSYDYQTNGSVRYIIQNPSDPLDLCVIMMAKPDSTTAATANRWVYFSYSDDGGRTWSTSTEISTVNLQGFPCMSMSSSGTPTVALHESAPTSRVFVYQDVNFGAGAWTAVGSFPQTPAFMVWPHVAVTTNNNIVVIASPNDGATFYGHHSTWNGSAWSPLVEHQEIAGPSGNYSTEAGPGGLVYIHGIDYNEPVVFAGNKLFTSTDNGGTFTLQSGSNAPPLWTVDTEDDTLAAFIDGGRQGIYVGNEVHLVYAVYATDSEALSAPPNTIWFKKAKILHWSPSTGVDTVAGRHNMPNMTDTLTHALVTPVCQPSIGIYNNILYVIYTAYLRGNTQVVQDGSVVNAGEIFLTFSTDNGNTWSTPANITGTPNTEEKHPSVVRNFTRPAGDSVGVYYLKDMKAGGWVNVPAWGPAPVYGIYKKLGGGVIGIKQDLEVARNYELFQNYPNPFNPTTTISYYLQKNGNVKLRIYNVLGEVVTTLVDGYQSKGAKEISFNGSNLASGIYYYSLETEGFKDTKKMILVK